jgi:hypothetical protein
MDKSPFGGDRLGRSPRDLCTRSPDAPRTGHHLCETRLRKREKEVKPLPKASTSVFVPFVALQAEQNRH